MGSSRAKCPLRPNPGVGLLRTVCGAFLLALALAGCGLFGPGQTPAAPSTPAGAESGAGPGGTEPSPNAPADPFGQGVLKAVVNEAPPGSPAQYLAVLADDFGWETEVNQDLLLRRAIAAQEFQERVEPRLLGLFFKRGFSVFPSVGEGHEFSRDTLVRGAVANRQFLVRAKGPVRIIFLEPADNIVIVYAKNAEQPQIFSRVQTSTVAVRESRSELHLN